MFNQSGGFLLHLLLDTWSQYWMRVVHRTCLFCTSLSCSFCLLTLKRTLCMTMMYLTLFMPSCPLIWQANPLQGWSHTSIFHGIKYLCMTSEQGRCNSCLFFSSGDYNVWNALQETPSQSRGWLGEETSGCCQATQQVQRRGQTNSATTMDIAILHAGMAWAWVEAKTIATSSEEHTWPPQVCCWAWVEHPCLADTGACLCFWAVTLTSLLVSKGI